MPVPPGSPVLGRVVETPIFAVLEDGCWPELAARPVRKRCSDARALYPDTEIAVVCEPKDYQQLSRQWHDRDTAGSLDAALQQIELERASCPPGSRLAETRPAGRVLTSARRALEYLCGALPPVFPPVSSGVPEDDMPTELIPVVREEP